MKGRKLTVRKYNQSTAALSATAVLVNVTTATTTTSQWVPVHISMGAAPGAVNVDLTHLPAGSSAPTAVRYAWGGVGGTDPSKAAPNGDDVSCCEGNGLDAPCVPSQCPLLAAEPLAPFGSLPIDPFVAEIKGNKCLCPEPQICSA